MRLPDACLDLTAMLGMNFLTDNDVPLVVDGAGGSLVGYFAVPGFQTPMFPVRPRGSSQRRAGDLFPWGT